MTHPIHFLIKCIKTNSQLNEHERSLKKTAHVKEEQKAQMNDDQIIWSGLNKEERVQAVWLKLEKVFSPTKNLSETAKKELGEVIKSKI
ncbi:MAG: hypothetical protein QNL04_09480 [SAR324 cluster bacterium]|nr:hypothetical protein [SAR324 cluster bacterium]